MKTFVMNESLFQCQKIITQRDVENKQLKEENEKVRKEEHEQVESRKVESRKGENEQVESRNVESREGKIGK